MTEIEVVRRRGREGLFSLPPSEQDRRMVAAIVTTRSLEERRRLIGLRGLLQKHAMLPPAPPILAVALVSRVLDYEGPVCAVPGGAVPVSVPPGDPAPARTGRSVDVVVSRRGVGCRADAPAGPQKAPAGRKKAVVVAASGRRFGLDEYSAPVPVQAVRCRWKHFADPYRRVRGYAAVPALAIPHTLVRTQASEEVPVYRGSSVNTPEIVGLYRRLEQVRTWNNTAVARFGSVVHAVVPAADPAADPVADPAADPAAEPAPDPPAELLPLGWTRPYVEDTVDIRNAADWAGMASMVPRYAATLLSLPEMGRIGPVLYGHGPSSEEFRGLLAAWEAKVGGRRAQWLAARRAARLRERMRGLMDLLGKVAPATGDRVAAAMRTGKTGFPVDEGALRAAITATGTAGKDTPEAVWKRLLHKDKEERDYWLARTNNSCAHVGIYRRARKAVRVAEQERALASLAAALEPEFKTVDNRWIRCTNCKLPAICPHALREMTLGARGAGENQRRTALARFEARGDGNPIDAADMRSHERHCRICNEILFYDVAESQMAERVSRSNIPDEVGAAVRRELRMAASHVRSAYGNFSAEQIVVSGEEPVGMLYSSALAVIRRDKVATPEALAARAASALGLYVYAFIASLVTAMPALTIEGAANDALPARPGARPDKARAGKVMSATLRLFAGRYAQQVAAIADSRESMDKVLAGESPFDLTPSAIQKSAQGKEKPSSSDASALRARFVSAFTAIGTIRAPIRTVDPVDAFVARIIRGVPFGLLAQARAEFMPAKDVSPDTGLSGASAAARAAAYFGRVMGAPAAKFLPQKNLRPARGLWGGVDVSWVPASPRGDRFRYMWLRVALIVPADIGTLAAGLARHAPPPGKAAGRVAGDALMDATIPWTRARVAALRLATMGPPAALPYRQGVGVVAYAGLKVWRGPHKFVDLPALGAAQAFTPTGERRRYVSVLYGKALAAAKTAPDWTGVTPAAYVRARVADQDGHVLGAPHGPDPAADDRAATEGFTSRALQRGFFTLYLARCPEGGSHNWVGTAPAPPFCEKCGITQARLFATMHAASQGLPISKEALAYYRKHIAASGIKSRGGTGPDTASSFADGLRTRPAIPPDGFRGVGSAVRLAQLAQLPGHELLMLGAYAGLTAHELKDKRAELIPSRFAVDSIVASVYIFVRRWEMLRRLFDLGVVPEWARAVIARAKVPHTHNPKIAAALAALPSLALVADKPGHTPLSDFPQRLRGALVAYKSNLPDLYTWALDEYASLCLWAAGLAGKKAHAGVGGLLEAFAFGEAADAVRRSKLMLFPIEVSEVRMMIQRQARRGLGNGSNYIVGSDLAQDNDGRADAEILEMGAGVETAADVFHGNSDYEGANAENEDMDED